MAFDDAQDDPGISPDEATRRYFQRQEARRLGAPTFPPGLAGHPPGARPGDPWDKDHHPTQTIGRKSGPYVFRHQTPPAGRRLVRPMVPVPRPPGALAQNNLVAASIIVHDAIRLVKMELARQTAEQIRGLSPVQHPGQRIAQARALEAALQSRLTVLEGLTVRQAVRDLVGPVTPGKYTQALVRAKTLVVAETEKRLSTSPEATPLSWTTDKTGTPVIARPTLLRHNPTTPLRSDPHARGFAHLPQGPIDLRAAADPAYAPQNNPLYPNPHWNPVTGAYLGRDDRETLARIGQAENQTIAEARRIMDDPQATPAAKAAARERIETATGRRDRYRERWRAANSYTSSSGFDVPRSMQQLERERALLIDARRLVTGTDIYSVMATSALAEVQRAAEALTLSHIRDEYGVPIERHPATARIIAGVRSYTDRFLATHRLDVTNDALAEAQRVQRLLGTKPVRTPDEEARLTDANATIRAVRAHATTRYSGTPGRLYAHDGGYVPGRDANYTHPAYAYAREHAEAAYVRGLNQIAPTIDPGAPVPVRTALKSGGLRGFNRDAFAYDDLSAAAIEVEHRRRAAPVALAYVRTMAGFYQPPDMQEIKGSGGYRRPTEDRALRRIAGLGAQPDEEILIHEAGVAGAFDEANWAADAAWERGVESDWAMISNNPGAGMTGNQKDVAEKSPYGWAPEQIDFMARRNEQRRAVVEHVVPHLGRRINDLVASATAAEDARAKDAALTEAGRLETILKSVARSMWEQPMLGVNGAGAMTLPFGREAERPFYREAVDADASRFMRDSKAERRAKLAHLREINDEIRQRARHHHGITRAEDLLYLSAMTFQGSERSPLAVANSRRTPPQTSSYEFGATGTGTPGGLYARMRSGVINQLGGHMLDLLPSSFTTDSGLRMPFNPLLATLRAEIESGTFVSAAVSGGIRASAEFTAMRGALDGLAYARTGGGQLAMSPAELLEIARERTKEWSMATGDHGSERARWLEADPRDLFGELFLPEISEVGRALRSGRSGKRGIPGPQRNMRDRLFAGLEGTMARPLASVDFFHAPELVASNTPVWGEEQTKQDAIIRGAFRLGRKALGPLPHQKQWDASSHAYVRDDNLTFAIEDLRGEFGLAQSYGDNGFWRAIREARQSGDPRLVADLQQRKSEQLALRGRLGRLSGVQTDLATWQHEAQRGAINLRPNQAPSLGLIREASLIDHETGEILDPATALRMHHELRASLFEHQTLSEAAPDLAAFLGGQTDRIGGGLIERGAAAPAHAPPVAQHIMALLGIREQVNAATGERRFASDDRVRRTAAINQLETSAVLNAAWEAIFGASRKDYVYPLIDPVSKQIEQTSWTGSLAQFDVDLRSWGAVNEHLRDMGKAPLSAAWGMIGGATAGNGLAGHGFGLAGIQTAEGARDLQDVLASMTGDYRAAADASLPLRLKHADLTRVAELLRFDVGGPHVGEVAEPVGDLLAKLTVGEDGYVDIVNPPTRYGVERGSHRNVRKRGQHGDYAVQAIKPYSRVQFARIHERFFDYANPESLLGQLIRDPRLAGQVGGNLNQRKLTRGDLDPDQPGAAPGSRSYASRAVERRARLAERITGAAREWWAEQQKLGIVDPATRRLMAGLDRRKGPRAPGGVGSWFRKNAPDLFGQLGEIAHDLYRTGETGLSGLTTRALDQLHEIEPGYSWAVANALQHFPEGAHEPLEALVEAALRSRVAQTNARNPRRDKPFEAVRLTRDGSTPRAVERDLLYGPLFTHTLFSGVDLASDEGAFSTPIEEVLTRFRDQLLDPRRHDTLPVERMSLGGPIRASQAALLPGVVNAYLNNPDLASPAAEAIRPVVVEQHGTHYVVEGHHRIAAAMVRGETELDAFVLRGVRPRVPHASMLALPQGRLPGRRPRKQPAPAAGVIPLEAGALHGETPLGGGHRMVAQNGGFHLLDPNGAVVAGTFTHATAAAAAAHFGALITAWRAQATPHASAAATMNPAALARSARPTLTAAPPSAGPIARYTITRAHDRLASSDALLAFALHNAVTGEAMFDITGQRYLPLGAAERGAFDPARYGQSPYLAGTPWDDDQLQALNLGTRRGGASPVLIAPAGAGKTRVEIGRVLKALADGVTPERAPLLVSFANKTVDNTEQRLKDALGPAREGVYTRYKRAHGATTLHSLGLRAARKMGIDNVFGYAGQDLLGQGDQPWRSTDFGGLSEADVLAGSGRLVERDGRGALVLRQGLSFDPDHGLKQASHQQVVETFREAIWELAHDDRTPFGRGGAGNLKEVILQHFSDELPWIEDGQGRRLRRGRGAPMWDRFRTAIGIDANMSDREQALFKRMNWLDQLGLDDDRLTALLDPQGANAIRYPGADTVGNAQDFVAALISQRMDQILQRGALVEGADGERVVGRYYRPVDMINKPLHYLERGGRPTELGNLFGRDVILAEGQDTAPNEYRLAVALAGGRERVMVSGDPDQDIFSANLKAGGNYMFRAAAQAAESSNALIRLRNVHRLSAEMTGAITALTSAVGFLDEQGVRHPILPREPDIAPGAGATSGAAPIVLEVGTRDLGPGVTKKGRGGGEFDQYRAVAEAARHLTGRGMNPWAHANEQEFVHNLDPDGTLAGSHAPGQLMALVRSNQDVANVVRQFASREMPAVAYFANDKLNRWKEIARFAEDYGIGDDDRLEQIANLRSAGDFHDLLNPRKHPQWTRDLDQFLTNVNDPEAELTGAWHGANGQPNFNQIARAIRTARQNLSLPHLGDGAAYDPADHVMVATYHAAKGDERAKVFVLNATERMFPSVGKTEIEARTALTEFLEAFTRGTQAIVVAPRPTRQQLDDHGRATGASAAGIGLSRFALGIKQWTESGGLTGGLLDEIDIGPSPRDRAAQHRLAQAAPPIPLNPGATVRGPGLSLPAMPGPNPSPSRAWRYAARDGSSMARIHPFARTWDQFLAGHERALRGEAFAAGGTIDPLSLPGDHAIVGEAGPEYVVFGDRSVLVDEPTVLPKEIFRGRSAQVIPAREARAKGRVVAGRLALGLGLHPALANGSPDLLDEASVHLGMDLRQTGAPRLGQEIKALLQATGAEVDLRGGTFTARNISRDRLAYTRDAAQALAAHPRYQGLLQAAGLGARINGGPVEVADRAHDPAHNLAVNIDHAAERIQHFSASLDLASDAAGSAQKVMQAIASGEFTPGLGQVASTRLTPSGMAYADPAHFGTPPGAAARHPATRITPHGATEYFDFSARTWRSSPASAVEATAYLGSGAPRQPGTVAGGSARGGGTSGARERRHGSDGGGDWGGFVNAVFYSGALSAFTGEINDAGNRMDRGVAQREQMAQQRNRMMTIVGFDMTSPAAAGYRASADQAYEINRDALERLGYDAITANQMMGDVAAAGGFNVDPVKIERLTTATEHLAKIQEESSNASAEQIARARTEQQAAETEIATEIAARQQTWARIGYAGEMNGMEGAEFARMAITTGNAAGAPSKLQTGAFQEMTAGILIGAANASPLGLEDFSTALKYLGPTLMPNMSTAKLGGGEFDSSSLPEEIRNDPGMRDAAIREAKAAALVQMLGAPGVGADQIGRATNMFLEASRNPNLQQSIMYAVATGGIDRSFTMQGDLGQIGMASFNANGEVSGTSQQVWDPGVLHFAGQRVAGRYDLRSQQNQLRQSAIALGLQIQPQNANSAGQVDLTNSPVYTLEGRAYRGEMALTAEHVTLQTEQVQFDLGRLGEALGRQESAFGSQSAVTRADFAEYATQLQFQISPEVSAQRRAAFYAQQAQATANLDRQGANLERNRLYEDALYGTPGSDQSYAAYVNASRQGVLAGQGSELTQLAGQVVPGAPVGLENQMAYRSLEHNRLMTVFGQSGLNKGAMFEEQMRYFDFQEAYLAERNDLTSDKRAGDRESQDGELNQAIATLRTAQTYAVTMFEENERHMQAEAAILPLRNQAMEDNLALQEANLARQREELPLIRQRLELQSRELELRKQLLPGEATQNLIEWNRANELLPINIAGYNAEGNDAQGGGFGVGPDGTPRILDIQEFWGPVATLYNAADADGKKRITRQMSSSLQSDPVLQPFMELFGIEEGQVQWDKATEELLKQGGAGVGAYVDPNLIDEQAHRYTEVNTELANLTTNLGNVNGKLAELYESSRTGQADLQDSTAGQVFGSIGNWGDTINTLAVGGWMGHKLLGGSKLASGAGKLAGKIPGLGRIFGGGAQANVMHPMMQGTFLRGAGVGMGLGIGGGLLDWGAGELGWETKGSFGTIGTMAGMGMMVGGPWGAAIGAGLGAGYSIYKNREAIGSWMGDHGMGAEDVQRYSDQFATWLNKTGDRLAELGASLFEGIGDLASGALDALLDPGALLKAHAPEGLAGAAEFVGNLLQAFTNPIGFLQEGLPEVLGAAADFVTGVAGWIRAAGDEIGGWFEERWDDLTGIGARIGGWLLDLPGQMIGRAADTLDLAAGLGNLVLNALIVDPINGLIGSISGKKWEIDNFPDIQLPKIPPLDRFATGTPYAPGGLAMVGEHGPELIRLPRGAAVENAVVSSQLLELFQQGGAADRNGDLMTARPSAMTLDPAVSRTIAERGPRTTVEIREINVTVQGGPLDAAMISTLKHELGAAIARDLNDLLQS